MSTFIIALCIAAGSLNPELTYVRSMFLGTYKNAPNARKFYAHTHAHNPSSSLFLGYKGVSEIMMCEHVWSPISKLVYFNSGKQLLESAIFAEHDNVELRYLRFTIQTNVPKILGYAAQIDEDKKILIGYVSNVGQSKADDELSGMVRAYLLNCTYLTENEKSALKQLCAGTQ